MGRRLWFESVVFVLAVATSIWIWDLFSFWNIGSAMLIYLLVIVWSTIFLSWVIVVFQRPKHFKNDRIHAIQVWLVFISFLLLLVNFYFGFKTMNPMLMVAEQAGELVRVSN